MTPLPNTDDPFPRLALPPKPTLRLVQPTARDRAEVRLSQIAESAVCQPEVVTHADGGFSLILPGGVSVHYAGRQRVTLELPIRNWRQRGNGDLVQFVKAAVGLANGGER